MQYRILIPEDDAALQASKGGGMDSRWGDRNVSSGIALTAYSISLSLHI